MSPVDPKPLEEQPENVPSVGDPAPAGGIAPDVDPMLARVKKVAQKIIERVKRVTGDTVPDHPALPTDPMDEVPPISE